MGSDTIAVDGSRTFKTSKRDKQPEMWDSIIKERDGKESGARVEIWWSKDREAWEKVEGGHYGAQIEDQAVHGDDKRPSITVKVTRGKVADYVQDGRPIGESKYSRQLRERFETIGWKEIKARGLFEPGVENDPTAYL